MSVVRRRRDGVEALEHAMQGVQTVEPRSFGSHSGDPAILGRRSSLCVDACDATVERELTIVMRRLPHHKRSR